MGKSLTEWLEGRIKENQCSHKNQCNYEHDIVINCHDHIANIVLIELQKVLKKHKQSVAKLKEPCKDFKSKLTCNEQAEKEGIGTICINCQINERIEETLGDGK